MPDPVSGIVGGAALLGGISGSKSSGGGTTTTTSSSAPWDPQQPYLTSGFKDARTALDGALKNPVYQGPRVANLNPFTTSGANLVGNYANTNFNNVESGTNAANSLLTAGANYGNNAADIYARYSGVDPTNTILENAGRYANNPYVDGIIDSAGRDVTRQLNENTLPSLNRQFSGTGNTNSTRAGVESAIAQRGAADRLSDMSSDIRGKFFGQGLTMAKDQYNTDLVNSLSANRGIYDAFTGGNSGMKSSADLANSYGNMLTNAGSIYSNYDQNILDADRAKFDETNANPLDYIQKYMASVGGNYGGTSSGTSTAPSSGGGIMGAITGALGGAAGGIGIASKAKTSGLFGP